MDPVYHKVSFEGHFPSQFSLTDFDVTNIWVFARIIDPNSLFYITMNVVFFCYFFISLFVNGLEFNVKWLSFSGGYSVPQSSILWFLLFTIFVDNFVTNFGVTDVWVIVGIMVRISLFYNSV